MGVGQQQQSRSLRFQTNYGQQFCNNKACVPENCKPRSSKRPPVEVLDPSNRGPVGASRVSSKLRSIHQSDYVQFKNSQKARPCRKKTCKLVDSNEMRSNTSYKTQFVSHSVPKLEVPSPTVAKTAFDSFQDEKRMPQYPKSKDQTSTTTNMDCFRAHDISKNMPFKPFKEKHTLTYSLYPSKNWRTSRSLMKSSFNRKDDGKIPPRAKAKSPSLKCRGSLLFETTANKSFRSNSYSRRDPIVPRKRTPYATMIEYR